MKNNSEIRERNIFNCRCAICIRPLQRRSSTVAMETTCHDVTALIGVTRLWRHCLISIPLVLTWLWRHCLISIPLASTPMWRHGCYFLTNVDSSLQKSGQLSGYTASNDRSIGEQQARYVWRNTVMRSRNVCTSTAILTAWYRIHLRQTLRRLTCRLHK